MGVSALVAVACLSFACWGIARAPAHLQAFDQRAVTDLALTPSNIVKLLGNFAPSEVRTSVRLRQATCAISVLQASNFLARAGVAIDQATKTCQAPYLVGWSSFYKKSVCAVDAGAVFSSIMWVATYLSQAASRCARAPSGVNVPALCASTIEGLIAGLAGAAVQAGFVVNNCAANSKAMLEESTDTDAVWQMASRRLQESDAKFAPDRDGELATCVLDVTQASLFLAQMGTSIKGSARACPIFHALDGVPVLGTATHQLCATEIGEVLWTVGNAAAYIAAATAHCSEGLDVQSLCGAGIAGLLSTLAGVVYLGSGMALACTEAPKLPFEKHTVFVIGQGMARRLGANGTSLI